MTPLRPLNLMPYSKDDAIVGVGEQIGWRAYPRKHGESLFTKFFQNYYLPTKFGYDKRRPHLSSLVASGSITRDRALELLQEPLYDDDELRRDRQYICRKLRISEAEFEDLMNRPIHHYTDFDNWEKQYARMKSMQARIGQTQLVRPSPRIARRAEPPMTGTEFGTRNVGATAQGGS